MLFNSLAFGICLIVALIFFWSSPKSHRVYILLGLSYFFYMYSFPIYSFLLFVLTVLNFALAMEIADKPKYAKHFLISLMALSVCMLLIRCIRADFKSL